MKNIQTIKYCCFIFSILICDIIISNAQIQFVHDDFEGNGTIDSWFGDDCGINTHMVNPFQSEYNMSSTVLEYHDTGGTYANVRFDIEDYFDLSSNHEFSLNIYVPSSELTGNHPNQISLKLQDKNLGSPWVTQSEIIKPIILDQWQTVTFNFARDDYFNFNPGSPAPTQRTDFNRVVIQLNGENNNFEVLGYLDDVIFESHLTSNPQFDHLVWSDEFEMEGIINSDLWFHQTKLPNGVSWFNGEIQHYTNRMNNSFVENGVLKILAKKENFTDQGHTKQYTSARLNSKFAFKYGRVEIRAKLPSGIGTWPAIWMLGQNINEDGAYWEIQGYGTTPWPACGEIDIMEHWGTNQNFVQSAIHTPSSFGGTVNYGGQHISTASTDFHIYELRWTRDEIEFSVDGNVHFSYNPAVKNADTWPFDAKQYLILNVAILPNVTPSFNNSAMEIDYVRVYQESPISHVDFQEKEIIHIFPNPFVNSLNIQLEKAIDPQTTVCLYNVNGQYIPVSHEVIRNSMRIHNVGHLPAGIYLVHLSSATKNQILKVVKR